MSKKERFEVFYECELGKWVIKDNEQMPHLLDNYKSCVRLNEFAEKVIDLQSQLAITEKALKLACEWLNDYQYFDYDCPRYSDCWETGVPKFWDCSNCDCSKLAVEYFKSKAKEILGNE